MAVISCGSNESNSGNSKLTIDERDKVDFWITDYKNVVFQRCLFLGFSKSSEIRNDSLV